MFKKANKNDVPPGGPARQESPRPQKTQSSSSSKTQRPPNVLNVTPSVVAEANTIGAARRVTPVILGKANQSDSERDHRASSSERRRPERSVVPMHSAPLHIFDEHSHFADTLSRRMERYIDDNGNDCMTDPSLTNRFGEARSARSSLMSSEPPRELEKLMVPTSDSAPRPSPNFSRRDTRVIDKGNSGMYHGSSATNSLLLVGSGAAVVGTSNIASGPSSSPHQHPDDDDKESTSASGSSYSRPRTVPSNPRGGGMAESSPRRSHQQQVLSPATAAMMLADPRRGGHRRGSRDQPKQVFGHTPRRGPTSKSRGEESCLEALAAIERRTDQY